MDLSIIMPAYNEQERIKDNLEDYARTFNTAEILVVIEGQDGTKDIVRDLSKKYKNIKYEYSRTRLGKGRAIRYGFTIAEGDLIGFADSDGSISAQEFKKLLSLGDLDGVIASRRAVEAKIVEDRPLSQRIGSVGLNLLSRFMFGLHFKDTQCGAKIFRRDALKAVINDLVIMDFAFDINLLYSLKKKGFKIKEQGIVWKHMRGSKFSFSTLYWRIIPQIALSLLKLRFKSVNY
ncbi:MAG: glycosyltransferase [Nanoarchaeota archaeon]